jgi:predicted Rossmann fold flavoprotein
MERTEVVVLGGGAAGFFAAVNCALEHAHCRVTILEKSSKLLAKVKVSGGGRCNVTHHCFDNKQLAKNYPRGEQELRSAFSRFSAKDTVEWFESRGVELKAEEDGRMFPVTDNSHTIIDCLMQQAELAGVRIKMNTEVMKVEKKDEGFILHLRGDATMMCDKLLIATGGNPKDAAYDWLRALGHTIASPVPSLFTFNIPGSAITQLMGVSVERARVRVAASRLEQEGPLLITHWGLSGPAVLKLSAWGARILHEMNYSFTALVNWIPEYNEATLREELLQIREEHAARIIASRPLFGLPRRLWEYLVSKAGISDNTRWADLAKKSQNILINLLVNDEYKVSGKTTFKEEFVTCGGVVLKEIDLRTMESTKCSGLYFAGEVLDIDGVTGGFNFQAAWTSGWISAQAMGSGPAKI